MPRLWKEGIVNMDGIVEFPKCNQSLMLSTLLRFDNNFDGEAKTNKTQNDLAYMKHKQVIYAHSCRCIRHIRIIDIGKFFDCVGGSRPDPPNQSRHTLDTNLKHLSSHRDRKTIVVLMWLFCIF